MPERKRFFLLMSSLSPPRFSLSFIIVWEENTVNVGQVRETANRSVIWLRNPLTLPTVPLTTSSSVFTFQGCLCSLYFDDIFSNIFYSSILFFIFLLPHNIVFSSQWWPGYQSFIKCIFFPHQRCGSVFYINKKIFLFQKPKDCFFIGSHLADSNQGFRWIKRQKLFPFQRRKRVNFHFHWK